MIHIILLIGFGVSVSLNLVLIYAALNMLKKLETQEDYSDSLEKRIGGFFTGIQTVLANMRAIDDKQMFEKDDEVGALFTQLTVILGELRVLLYGKEETEEE